MESRVDLPTLRKWKLFIACKAGKEAYNCLENDAECSMRRHIVSCQIENEKETEYLQSKINETALLYIKEMMEERGFTKEEKLKIMDELIQTMKKKYTECCPKEGGHLCE